MKRIVALIMMLISISMAMAAPAMADERVTIEPTASGIPQELVREIKDLGLELTMTKEYSTEGSWSGPPEESQYNSREYRIKFFEDQGTYTGYQTFDGIPWSDLESGTWK